ncbi:MULTISPECIES: delta-class carbonic anhydrase [unclassified Pseudoalteromonas]|uniref:delta-class carbonic anhydrase n=1 Tax=unclassified Pseudoalteromonas TaxID=194690 RepID=UPI00386B8DB0
MTLKVKISLISAALTLVSFHTVAKANHESVSDNVLKMQRVALAENTENKGFGPQSPRNIDNFTGENIIVFSPSPASSQMNLCNIHFHKNAEHAGGEFSKYAGNGDGKGFQSGYLYSGVLTKNESKSIKAQICPSIHGALSVGDTIEVHNVHTSAIVKPGPTLGSCLSDSIKNPQLRVEAQVYVLVNDANALDFTEISTVSSVNGYYQAIATPTNTGEPVVYSGSTTGPSYNETGSPFQVTWSVKPKVAKVDINSISKWCESNTFNEDHAHGVRNLVTNPALLSIIQ